MSKKQFSTSFGISGSVIGLIEINYIIERKLLYMPL